ncbi:3-dehydroquinate dehydratase (3-dehydroquinase) [Savitreella phatthalungensis]
MDTLPILGRESIFVGYNLLPDVVQTCVTRLPSSAYVIITDTNLAPVYLERLVRLFEHGIAEHQAESRVLSYVVSPGESSKTRQTKSAIEDWLLTHRCTRDTVILALGGGVIGDMIGFVAATFMRGVRFVQLPTTLLAMVDSSIGGKTAVDTPDGKNLIGAFHQPEFIFEDLAFLNTLPNREFINGMAEVIKTAAIWESHTFVLLEQAAVRILEVLKLPISETRFDGIRDLLKSVVLSSIRVKAAVVSADEKEGGLRNLLNFGHSIGHAYEAILTPQILHGEAVSVGMVKEAELARYLGHLSPASVVRLTKCLASWGLPTSVHDPLILSRTDKVTPVERLLDIMAVDKKNAGRTKKIVLLKAIGHCLEQKASSVADDDIRFILSEHVMIGPAKGYATSLVCRPPGSKSISNRALVLAALSGGKVLLKNLLASDDVRWMQAALEDLGAATFEWDADGSLCVRGTGRMHPPKKPLYLGNAGTAARFLTGVASLVPGSEPVILTGNKRMRERPIGPLVEALRSNGVAIDYLESQGCLPLSITPGFAGGEVALSADVSSQYVSALLMIAPLARQEVTLRLLGDKVISETYIDMTAAMMRSFGVHVEKRSSFEYFIPRAAYVAPETYEIESDASSATYPLALGALLGIEVTIPNIGTDSLQGDAAFARSVLKPMGCEVRETAGSTTIIGPKTLRAIGKIDMEPMTDAFLTASVLAALADGPTTITGIANQRVKECNRIRAMMDELSKFGIRTEEHDDGLTIHGGRLSSPVPIKTYDDHRVAMSFSLLGVVSPSPVVILDKQCTGKTWPGWWDTLRAIGVELAGLSDEANPVPRGIVLVGMRGAGKSTVGEAMARHLDLEFCDLDVAIEQSVGSLRDYVRDHGWQMFRDVELTTLRRELARKGPRVLACGGGTVETPAARELLSNYAGDVIYVHRDIEDIVAYLSLDATRPSYGEDVREVYRRRQPWYEQISSFTYHNDLQDVSRWLTPASGTGRAFVSLTRDVTEIADIDLVTVGCDAIEVRVDLLSSDITAQIRALRNKSKLPIIFTLRSASQGGRFQGSEDDALAILSIGARLAVDYIDFETTWSVSMLTKLRKLARRSTLIASHHDAAGEHRWNSSFWQSKYEEARAISPLVKLVSFARSLEDNTALEAFRLSKPGLIAINMGSAGALSRILNPLLTPVSHESMERAAPGQLSLREINTALVSLGCLRPASFYIFGTPVQHSRSPAMHNAGFKALALPYTYEVAESAHVATYTTALKTIGGASVTIPHKQAIMEMLDEVTPAAREIGAVNTIVRLGNGRLLGENTDWQGIVAALGHVPDRDAALVLGAGGTARAAVFALRSMGFKSIYAVNRSGLDKLSDISYVTPYNADSVSCIVSTVPADGQIDGAIRAALDTALSRSGVLLEMAYKPRITAIMQLAEQSGWRTVPGVEALVQQGILQFKLWTGYTLPENFARAAVLDMDSRSQP